MRVKLLVAIIIHLSLASFSFAQLSANSVALKTSPLNISSNQNFEIYLESYSFNVDKAKYTWKVNGQTVAAGEGVKSVNLKTGSGGQILNITVTISTIDGQTFTVSKIINPGEINLVWESINGYTPSWYEGKTLNTYGGQIKVSAFPMIIENGVLLNSNNLIYRWYVNDEIDNKYSGLGKNFIIYQGIEEELDNVTIDVEVESKNSETIYSKSLKIPFVKPEINLYEKNNTLGVLSNFLLTNVISFANKEANIVAEPFYFSTKIRDSLSYIWEINDRAGLGQSNSERLIKIPSDKQGTSKINVTATDKNKLLQTAKNGFVIKF
jgi:hypothetical protein